MKKKNVNTPSWTTFHHEADIGVRGTGASVESAFVQAGLALTGVMTSPENVKLEIEKTITCEAPSLDILFYDWINELIYLAANENLIFGRYEVLIKDLHLTGKAWGEIVSVERHAPAVEIKGATFTELKVYLQEDGLWVAQCVVDV